MIFSIYFLAKALFIVACVKDIPETGFAFFAN
jgi:hypothetical protein